MQVLSLIRGFWHANPNLIIQETEMDAASASDECVTREAAAQTSTLEQQRGDSLGKADISFGYRAASPISNVEKHASQSNILEAPTMCSEDLEVSQAVYSEFNCPCDDEIFNALSKQYWQHIEKLSMKAKNSKSRYVKSLNHPMSTCGYVLPFPMDIVE